MRVLFVNDSATAANWGDRAAASSLRRMIAGSGGEIVRSISEDEIFRLSAGEHATPWAAEGPGGTRETVKQFVPPIVLKARRRIAAGLRLHGAGPIPQEWEAFDRSAAAVLGKEGYWRDLLRDAGESDLTVVHGDGSMVGEGPHPRTLLFLSYIVKKHLGKPVVIVNHTADFDQPRLLGMAQGVYPLFDDVVFRDLISVERCAALCDGRYAPDTAFLYGPASLGTWAPLARRPGYFDVWPDAARFDPSEPYLCLGGSSAFGPVEDRAALVEGFVALVGALRSVYPGQIVLTASDLADQTVFRPLARQLGLPLIAMATSTQQAVDVLGNADAYIGGRWHPSIFALRGGTPVIALSARTFKMRALMEMAGLPPATFDALGLADGRRGVVEQLVSSLEQGVELRARLRAWAQQQADDSWDNVRYLKDHETPPHPAVGGMGPSVRGER